jgi:hypothetical protein
VVRPEIDDGRARARRTRNPDATRATPRSRCHARPPNIQVANSEEEAKARAEGFGDPPIDVYQSTLVYSQIRNQQRDQAAQKIYDQG